MVKVTVKRHSLPHMILMALLRRDPVEAPPAAGAVTVTLPDGSTITPATSAEAPGVYVTTFVATQSGRYVMSPRPDRDEWRAAVRSGEVGRWPHPGDCRCRECALEETVQSG